MSDEDKPDDALKRAHAAVVHAWEAGASNVKSQGDVEPALVDGIVKKYGIHPDQVSRFMSDTIEALTNGVPQPNTDNYKDPVIAVFPVAKKAPPSTGPVFEGKATFKDVTIMINPLVLDANGQMRFLSEKEVSDIQTRLIKDLNRAKLDSASLGFTMGKLQGAFPYITIIGGAALPAEVIRKIVENVLGQEDYSINPGSPELSL